MIFRNSQRRTSYCDVGDLMLRYRFLVTDFELVTKIFFPTSASKINRPDSFRDEHPCSKTEIVLLLYVS